MCEGNQVLLPFSETLPLDEIVELTQRLIEFHSTPDNPAELAACRAFLTEWCAREGLNARAYDVRPGGVLYVGPDSGRAPLLLLSHFDVAAGPDALFSPLLCDDQLYGRGALDDKYAVALSLVLYREACRTAEQHGGTQEDVPLMLLLSGGGEEDDMLGIQSVLETLMPEFCIALDGGEPKHIVIKEKGMLRLELASYGEAADGAQPWKGKNATNTLIADYLVLLSLLQRKDNISDPTYWHPTLNLNKLRAGLSPNLVPDSATAQLDVRFTEYDGMLGAVIHPKNYILPLLRPHFCGRFPEENFMIYDAVHQAVLLQEDHKARLLELAAPLELPPPSEREQQFQALWKQFYQTLEIKARHNEKCRMTHCPKRFWADMVEMKDEF